MQAIDEQWLRAVQEKQEKKDLVFTSITGAGFKSVPVMVYSEETKQMHKLQIKGRDQEYSYLIYVSGQLFELSRSCLSVYPNPKDPAQIQKQHLADLPRRDLAQCSCLVNFNDEKILIIGGLDRNLDGKWVAQKTFARFELFDREWSCGPELNRRRENPAGCCIDSNIYVFGGIKDRKLSIPESSIEILDMKCDSEWQLLEEPLMKSFG